MRKLQSPSMTKKSQIEFRLLVFNKSSLIKKLSFRTEELILGSIAQSQVNLTKADGTVLLEGRFYWKSRYVLIFEKHFMQSEEIQATLLQNHNASAATFEYQNDEMVIQVRSLLIGEPPDSLSIRPTFTQNLSVPTIKKQVHKSVFVTAMIVLVVQLSLIVKLNERKNVRLEGHEQQISKVLAPTVNKPFMPRIPGPKHYEKIILKNKKDIEFCQKNFDFEDGPVQFKVLINPMGGVFSVDVLSSTLGVEIMECLNARIKSWLFPPIENISKTLFFAVNFKKES
ncbi:MAG: hypothetical protein HYS98_03245 [Deltaproteobacteria bacterium]|nr:hypothetical protein [Deltaproteobacteria bacterium]